MLPGARLLLALLLAAAPDVASAPPAVAPPARGLVIVLRPAVVDDLTATVLARVTGELSAARFRVLLMPMEATADPVQEVETVGAELAPAAAFAIGHVGQPSEQTVALWVCDRLARRTTIQRMAITRPSDTSTDAAVLAVEAIELIRISVQGLPHALPPPPAPAAPGDGSAGGHGTPPGPARGSIGIGPAALWDIGVGGPSWLAALTGEYRPTPAVAARAQLCAFSSDLTIAQGLARAAVRRELASVGVALRLASAGPLDGLVSGSLGFEHLHATGQAPSPAQTYSRDAWAAMLGAGAEARLHLAPHWALGLGAEALVTWPRVVLRFDNTETGAFLRPGLLVHGRIEAEF